MAGAPGIDVQPAAAGVTGMDAELCGFATLHEVHIDAFDAMLVEFVVVAKTHDVFKQPLLLDLRSMVRDAQTAPIGLPSDQAIAFEQMAGQCFSDRLLIERSSQEIRLRLVLIAFDVQPIQ